MKEVIICAAENAAIPGGKVGGVGDVIAALPGALARLGWSATVLMPGYGSLAAGSGAVARAPVRVTFAGTTHDVDVFEVCDRDAAVRILLFEHPHFSPQGPGHIYCHDGSHRPFATDAGKFALFSAACASYVRGLDAPPDVVHLHDWHCAFYSVLRAFDPGFASLQDIRTVFTIHNLAMQGIRPLRDDESSLDAFFPGLGYELAAVVDPRYPDCINPMAAGIRLSDRVNTVSPTYATEILRPNDELHGFHGGEGLERDLQRVSAEDRLFGILNGCDYPGMDRRRPGWRRLLDAIGGDLANWRGRRDGRTALHDAARLRLDALPKRRPGHLLTSIGRMTAQKAALFLQTGEDGATALDGILDDLGKEGCFIMLGSGDPELEHAFARVCGERPNFLYLAGFAVAAADLLYQAGDLFLMPSSFEPCGISQMLAMRAGQPCVVHAVGGLADTVRDNANGFAFRGDTPTRQATMFRAAVRHALSLRREDQTRWLRIREAARAARFTWDAAAMQYIGELYE